MMYLLKNGNIIDGSGLPMFTADVLIADGVIKEIGTGINAENCKVIDATGCVITPGFIDIHRHSDVAPLRDPSFGEIELRQGITTVIAGNCGLGPAPAPENIRRQLYDYLEPVIGEVPSGISFNNFTDYVALMTQKKLPLNMGFLAGADSIKAAVKGFSSTPYTKEELDKAASYMAEAMEVGAYGGSLGIMYLPECYSTKSEMAHVVKPIAKYDGILSTHIRGEGDSLVQSVEEVIDIAKSAGVRLNISHFKATGIKNWNSLIFKAIDLIEKARNEGFPVTVDFYPYDGGSTTLQSLLPPSVMESDPDSTLRTLATKEGKERFLSSIYGENPGWDNMAVSIGWDRILICSVTLEEDLFMQGKDIKTLSDSLGYDDPAEFVADLYVKEKGKVGIIVLSMSERDVEEVARLPYSVLISDSLYGGGKPHPRLFGSFPRFLRLFSMERAVLGYEEAVRKMTALPAERMGLSNRGRISKGCVADILIFKKESFMDNADYSGRTDLATGMKYVFIGGNPVIMNEGEINYGQGNFLLKNN